MNMNIPELHDFRANDESRVDLVEKIVGVEWLQFDRVNNLGGRADCQEDWSTFRIMRSAQFLNWPEELLRSYLWDLNKAETEGRNLVAEKYGRMMESTDPTGYSNICHLFPERSDERLRMQEEVIASELRMDGEISLKYPLFSSLGRPASAANDSRYVTSKETYIRGELSTWSDRTFGLYYEWFKENEKRHNNISEMIYENTARLYGYRSIMDIETRLKSKDDGLHPHL